MRLIKIQNNFFIVRHDVEFSTERALELAKIEKKDLNIRSSFFFQITNNSYNLLSYENRKIISSIQNMGHRVGLHFNYKGKNLKSEIKKELLKSIKNFNQEFKMNTNFFHHTDHLSFLFYLK